jgi:outer membrane protein assembly factor BamB
MPGSLLPPRRLLVTVLSLAAAIVLVRMGLLESVAGAIVDRAVRNIISLILAFSGLMALLGWFLWESGHPLAWKRRVVWGLLAAVAMALACFRIERVSGDLVPELAFRWSPSRDRLLPRAGSEPDGMADSGEPLPAAWVESPDDFPRFLGPRGTAGVDAVALDPEWATHPPRLLWRRAIGAGWSGFAVASGHAVTLEQRGEEEVVSCYDLTTGRPLWQVTVTARHQTVLGGTGPRSTPTIRDGTVFTTGATGWLHAIDGATGRVSWRKNLLDDLGIDAAAHAAAVTWGRAGSPLVTDTMVIVPGGGPLKNEGSGSGVALAAYDRATGERRWTAGDSQISYVSPILARFAGRDSVISVNESAVAAYDPVDGRGQWSFDWPGHSNSDATCSQPQPLDETRLFISKGYGIGAALFEADEAADDRPAFRRVWSRPNLLKTKFTNAAVHEGHAYGLSDGILECVRLSDGTRAWKGGRYGQGQVLRVGRLLLVQAESGEVVLVDCVPQAHRVRGRLPALNGQTWNTLALAGRRLLVRNAEEAACWELPLIEGATAGRGVAATQPGKQP